MNLDTLHKIWIVCQWSVYLVLAVGHEGWGEKRSKGSKSRSTLLQYIKKNRLSIKFHTYARIGLVHCQTEDLVQQSFPQISVQPASCSSQHTCGHEPGQRGLRSMKRGRRRYNVMKHLVAGNFCQVGPQLWFLGTCLCFLFTLSRPAN